MKDVNEGMMTGSVVAEECAKDGASSASSDVQPSKKKKKKQEIPVVLIARFEGLVDIVDDNGESAFLIVRDGQLIVTREIRNDSQIFRPPSINDIPWSLVSGSSVQKIFKDEVNSAEGNAKLFDDLVEYYKSVAELPSPEHYDLLAAWTFHTYLLEKAQYSPFIWFYAVAERGKSRVGKAMIFAAYRGLYVESVREPYIIRMAANFQATIFFDVLEFWKKAESGGSVDTMLMRFEKGARVPKVMNPDKGPFRDITYFETFGATIAATNAPVHDILETRCIQINMQESSRFFDSVVKSETALPIKERLLAARARHMMASIPEVEKPARSRLGDILRPLRQIIHFVRPEREATFLAFVQRLEAQRRQEKSNSVEAQIITTLFALETKVERCMLATKIVTDHFNVDRSENHKWTYQFMGHRLAALGFQKASMPNSNSAIIWDPGLLARIAERYGVVGTQKNQAALPSVPKSSGVPGVAGVPGVLNSTLSTQGKVETKNSPHIPPNPPPCFGKADIFVPDEKRKVGEIGDKCAMCPFEYYCDRFIRQGVAQVSDGSSAKSAVTSPENSAALLNGGNG